MTKTNTPDTNVKTDAVVSKKDALASVMQAMEVLTSACDGNAADALHAVVYGHDVSTRMHALYRYIASGPNELGQPLTVKLRYGGYEILVTRGEGRPDVTIACPDVTLIDKKGTPFGTEKYGAVGAEDLKTAIAKINPAIGRLGHAVATAQLTVHEPDTETPVKTRAKSSSATDAKLSALEQQIADQTAMMQALLAKLSS